MISAGNKKKTVFILLIFTVVADDQLQSSLVSAKLTYNNGIETISDEPPSITLNNKVHYDITTSSGAASNGIIKNIIQTSSNNNNQLSPKITMKSLLLPIITPKTWNKLDLQLFRLLSLTDVPKISTRTINTSSSSHYLYMSHVYNLIQNGSVAANQVGDFVLEQHHHKLMDSSHRIVSFKNLMPSPRYPKKILKMWFNVSEVRINNGVVDFAELKIYKNSQAYQRFSGQNNDTLDIHLYSCKLPSKINNKNNNNNELFTIVHINKSIKVSNNFQGWLSINITNIVRSWLENSSLNCGISIKSSYSSPMEFLQLEEDHHIHPFLVAYFRNSVDKFRQPKKHLSSRKVNKRTKRNTASDNEDCCHIESMMIDFQELGYEFIIHPMQYDAKRCTGSCLFPSSPNAHYLPHTVLQSLMHHKHPEIPEPVCSPSQLGTISILYFDVDKVILQHLPNMTIEACSCY